MITTSAPLITIRATAVAVATVPNPDGTSSPMLIMANEISQTALVLTPDGVARLVDELAAHHARGKLAVATELPPDLRG